MIPEEPLIVKRCTNILITHTELAPPSSIEILKKELTCTKFTYIVNLKRSIASVYNIFLLEDKDNNMIRVPVGFPIARLRELFPNHIVKSSMSGSASNVININVNSDFKNDSQKEIFNDLLNGFINGSQCVLSAETGYGKSYIAMKLWESMSTRMLAVFKQVNHLENFLSEILKFTDVKKEEILILNSTANVLKYAKHNEMELSKIKVVLTTHRTYTMSLKTHLDGIAIQPESPFSVLVRKLGIGFKFVDECHLEVKALSLAELTLNIKKNFYCSATVSRNDKAEATYYNYLVPKALIYKQDKIKRLEVVMRDYSMDTPEDCKFYNNGRFDTSRYTKFIMTHRSVEFKNFLCKLVEEILLKKNVGSIGIVASVPLDFIKFIVDIIAEEFPDKSLCNFTSLNANKMNELDYDILVSTEKSFNGSINPKNLTHIIGLLNIVAPTTVEQIAGRMRGFDDNVCVMYDLADRSVAMSMEMQKSRKTTYSAISKKISN